MARSLALLVLIFLAPSQAWASNTLCHFISKSDQTAEYWFEFIGGDEITMIQINEPRSLRLAKYEIRDFSFRGRQIDLVHTSSGETGFLPSFTLKGIGDNVLLSIAGQKIKGQLTCNWQLDDK